MVLSELEILVVKPNFQCEDSIAYVYHPFGACLNDFCPIYRSRPFAVQINKHDKMLLHNYTNNYLKIVLNIGS